MSQYSSTLPVVTPVPPVVPPPHNAARYTPRFKQTQKAWLNEIRNPARKMGLWAAYAFFFLRFTDLHMILTAKMGFNTYLLYFAGLPALLGLLLSDGLRRAFRLKSSWYLLGFMVLMAVASVFSSWMGGSIPFTWTYFRTSWISFLLLAGLIMTWEELWRMVQVIALCAAVNVLIGVSMSANWQQGGRAGVELGTNSNPNDFAAVLILVLPFLGLVLFTPKRNMLVRLAAVAFLLLGFYRVLSSGSRGALLGIAIALLYLLVKLPARLRVLAVLGGLVICLITVSTLPKAIIERLATWNRGSDTEAAESTEARKQLFQKSLLFTVQHPILGVGPEQFAQYEGRMTKAETGQKGMWHGTHNSYTQISSENGIPAAICFLMALGSSYGLIRRVFQSTRRRKPSLELKKLNMVALCLLVSMVGFCVAITFVNFGYLFFVPALVGLAVVLTEVTEREFRIPLGVNYRSPS
jgi:O-antigen ligase